MDNSNDFMSYAKQTKKNETKLDEKTIILLNNVKNVINMMTPHLTKSAKSVKSADVHNYKSIGQIVSQIIMILKKDQYVKLNNEEMMKKYGIKSNVDKIRFKQNIENINVMIEQLNGDKILSDNFGTLSTKDAIIEFKLIGLKWNINKILHDAKKIKKEKKDNDVKIKEQIYEYYLLLCKLIDIAKNTQFQEYFTADTFVNINAMFLENIIDFRDNVIDKYNKLFGDNLFAAELFEQFPHLLFTSSHDSYLIDNGFKLYDHQINLLNNFKNTYFKMTEDDSGKLVIYKPIMGSGKTFSVVLLAYLISVFNTQKYEPAKLQNAKLVFCCDQHFVLDEMYKYINHICNGTVSIHKSSGSNHLILAETMQNYFDKSYAGIKYKSQFKTILCDTASYIYLLDKNVITESTILFFDEPTMNSSSFYVNSTFDRTIYVQDNTNNVNMAPSIDFAVEQLKSPNINKHLIANMIIMTSVPKYKILSSATFPNLEDTQQIFGSTYDIEIITSDKLYVSSTIRHYNNNFIYMPHIGCTNKTQLNNIIKKINDDLFLKKMYSFHAVRQLYDTLIVHSVNIPSELNFANILKTDVNTTYIINYGISLLKLLQNETEEIISFVCKLPELSDEMVYDEYIKNCANDYVQNLIIDNDPVEFLDSNTYLKNYEPLDEIKTHKYKGKFSPENDEEIDALDKIDRKYKIMLSHKIGLITHDIKNNNYLQLVKKLAENNKLSFLISDMSIAYGTNYPINSILINKNVQKNHSINSLFQLFNRAGRVGKSWFANIFVEYDLIKRLSDVLLNDKKYDIEMKNMFKISQYLKLYNESKDKSIEFNFYTEKKSKTKSQGQISRKSKFDDYFE